MKDYPIERIYRDARITNIYEGTSQLQVVAAIRHVTTGTFLNKILEYEAQDNYPSDMDSVRKQLVELRKEYEAAVERVTSGDNEQIDFHARRLVEMAGHIIITYLLMRQAAEVEDYRNSAEVYAKLAYAKNKEAASYIFNSCCGDIDVFKAVIDEQ